MTGKKKKMAFGEVRKGTARLEERTESIERIPEELPPAKKQVWVRRQTGNGLSRLQQGEREMTPEERKFRTFSIISNMVGSQGKRKMLKKNLPQPC